MLKKAFLLLLVLSAAFACSVTPTSPSRADAAKLAQRILAGHNIGNLRVEAIQPFAFPTGSFQITYSFTLAPPKGKPKDFTSVPLLVSYDTLNHAWTEQDRSNNNSLLSTVESYEWQEAMIENSKHEKVYPNPWNHH